MQFNSGVFISLVALILVSNAPVGSQNCDSCVDLTRIPDSKGTETVLACVRLVEDSGIFTDDYHTLRRIAYAETLDGDESRSSSGGIWNVSEEIFTETMNSSNAAIHSEINVIFHIDWNSATYNDLDKPIYSALAARIFLQEKQNSGSDISSVANQTSLWITEYNSNGNMSLYTDAVNNAQTDDTEYTNSDFGATFKTTINGKESIRLKIQTNFDSPIQLEISSSPQTNIAVYVSNVAGTSSAIYCSAIMTNETGQLHITPPAYMLPYGSLTEVFITINVVDSEPDALVNVTMLSALLDINGIQSIGSYSSRFTIGMFSNHPDAVDLPITLLVTTMETSNVGFSVKSIDGIVMEGTVNKAEGIKVLIPGSYIVSSLTDSRKGLAVETTNETNQISVSVSSHDIYSSDSYLALPLIDYIDIDLYTYYATTPNSNVSELNHQLLLVGGHNDTTITVCTTTDAKISMELINNGVLIEGETYTFQLNQYDTILIQSEEYSLTGSKITADKPIALLSGHQCAVLPETGNSCDFVIEQYPPTINWGKTFMFPMISSRMSGSYISIVSSSNDTTVDLRCYSNMTNVNITDQVYFDKEGSFINILVAPDDVYCIVVSDQPIMVTLIGASENYDDSYGDPFMMIVPPVEQFYSNVSFIPNTDFGNSFVNIFSLDASVDIDGKYVNNWVEVLSLDNSLLGYVAQVDVVVADEAMSLQVSSNTALSFVANVYGFNFSTGYGQVAGMNFLLTEGEYAGEFQVSVGVVTVNPLYGQNIELSCVSNGPLAYAIRWKRNGEFIVPSCQHSISSSSRKNSLLVIYNSTFEDEGAYDCVAYSYYTANVPTAQTNVAITTSIESTVSPMGFIVLSYRENVTLECAIETYYNLNDLQFEWTLNNNTISTFTYSDNDDSFTWTVDYNDHSSTEHSGHYQCIARNIDEGIIGKSNIVLVSFAPIVTTNAVDFFVSQGNSAMFNCTAIGYPVPDILWYRVTNSSTIMDIDSLNDTTVAFPNDITINEYYITTTRISSYFYVNNVSPHDYGYYTCVARFDDYAIVSSQECLELVTGDGVYYDISETATLFVSPSASITPSVVHAAFGDEVSFTCSSNGGPDNQYQWIYLETNEIVQNGTILTIPLATYDNGGNYQCVVTNEAGSDTAISTIYNPVLLSSGPTDQEVEVGDNVTFTCEFQSRLDINATWYLDGEILTDKKIVTSETQSTLYLYEVDQSYSGNYTCEIDNGILYAVTGTGELTVAKITANLTPQGIATLYQGNELTISCSYDINPPLNKLVLYAWMFKDMPLNETDAVLTLQYENADSVEQGGCYQCTTYTSDGLLTGSSNRVHVVFAPFITTHPSFLYTVEQNDTLTLTCTASGNPPPVIEWYRVQYDSVLTTYVDVYVESIDLPSSSYNDTDSFSFYTQSSLIIDSVDYEDYGYYVCTAILFNDSFVSTCCEQESHMLGQDLYEISNTSTISVSPVGSVSVIPVELTVSYAGNSIFNCSSQGGPDNEYAWTHLSTGDIVGSEPDLVLNVTTLDNGGAYECTVSNLAGSENASTYLHVSLLPLTLLKGPETLTVSVADDVSLSCLFFTDIPATIVWLFNDNPISFPHQIHTTGNMSTISLVNVNSSNTGTYLCQIDNGIQGKINASGYLTIGQVTTTLIPTGVSVIEYGQSLEVFCNATVTIDLDDELLYTWTFNDEIINKTSSILTITYNSADSIEQGGVYHCVAKDTADILEGKSNQVLIAFAPIITVQPESVLTILGDVAELNCNAVGHPLPDIEWHKLTNNTNVSSFQELESFSIGLVQNDTMFIDNYTSSSTFALDSVAYADYGYYVCVAILDKQSLIFVQNCCNDEEVTELSFYDFSKSVTMTVSPDGSVQIDPITVDASFGDAVSFVCSSNGGPDNQYQWIYLETNEIVQNGNILTIPLATYDNGGNYQCIVTNEAGLDTAISTIYNPVLLLIEPKDQLVDVGDNVTFTCGFQSRLDINVTWYLDDEILTDNKIVTSENQSTLYLYEVDESYSGNYTCEIDNGILYAVTGTGELTVGRLTVNLQPIGITTLSFGDTVSINCSSESNVDLGDINYTWTQDGRGLNNTTTQLILTYDSKMSAKQGGIYQCYAFSSDVIVSGSSSTILIVFAPFITTHPSLSTAVKQNDTLNLTCTASGNPPPVIEWYRVQYDSTLTTYVDVLVESIVLPSSSYNDTVSSSYYTQSSLIIDSVDYEDYGYYVCTAIVFNESFAFVSTCCTQGIETYLLDGDIYNISNVSTVSVSPVGSVTVDPVDLTVYYADDAVFNCSSQGGPDNKYLWTHSSTGDIVGSEPDLFVNMTMLSDGGTYQCSVSNLAGEEYATGFLNVTILPLKILKGPETLTVSVADDVSLSCLFYSEIQATIVWLFNDNPISFPHQIHTTGNMSTISLVNVNSSNTGTYLCQLDNAEQEKVNASGYLTIGQVTTSLIPTGVSVIEFGQSLDVFCNATVTIDLDDELLYTWTFNDEIINETSSILTITYNSADSIEQGGVYHCVAKDTADILEGKSNQVLIAFAPIITVQPESVLTMPGDVAEMNCNATGHPLPVIEWHKLSMNTTISSLEELDFFSDELLYNETDYIGDILSASELLIDNVSYADFGYYICVASYDSALLISDCCTNYSNSMQKVYTAFSQPSSVTVSPIDSVQIYPPLINSSFNESIIFNCTSKGGPTNEYQWRHLQTNNVVGNEPILQIDSVSFDKSGSYICTVTNEAGSDSDTAVLNTPVLITSVSEDQTVAVGDTVELICTFKSLLHVTAVWMHNGSAVIDNAAIITSTNESRLSLIEATLSHSGNYTCVLDNGIIEIAMATSFIVVDHLVTSISPASGVFTLEYGNTVNVSCTVRINAATDGLFYSWTFNDVSLNITTQWFLLEYNSTLSVVQGGIYQCLVSSGNMIFNGASKQLLITYAPHFTVHPQSLVTTISSDTAIEFSCSAIAHPTPTIEWYRVNSIDNITELNVAQNSLILANSSFTESNTTDLFEVISFLTIDPVEYEDYGYYVCLASIEDSIIFVRNCCSNNDYNNDTINTSYTSLSTVGTLAVSPDGSVQIDPVTVDVSFGEEVSFTCSSNGGPDNQYQWIYLETNEIVQNETILTIPLAAYDNGGNYQCIVTNEAGSDTAISTIYNPVLLLSEPKDQLVDVGDNVTFTCGFQSRLDINVTWYSDDEILTDKKIVTSENQSTLYLYEVDESYSGNYTCEIDNGILYAVTGTGELTVGRLTVNLQPIGITTLSFGDTVSINCSSESNVDLGDIDYTWTQDGRGLNNTTTQLILTYDSKISAKQGGIYQCYAFSSDVIVSGSSSTILIVFAPFITTHPSLSTAVKQNDTLNLTCTASGNPPPVIEWYRVQYYSIDLPSSSYNDTVSSSYYTQSSLIIDSVDYEDYGYYVCTAILFNESFAFVSTCCDQGIETYLLDGDLYDISNVSTVSVSPVGSVTVDPVDLTVYYADDAVFNCSSQGGPDNEYLWTHSSTGDIVGSEPDLFVNMTMLSDGGTYQCSVSNLGGRENATGFLNVTILPLTILKGPDTLTVSVTDDVSLSCLFYSEIQATIVWLFNDNPISFPHQIHTTGNMSTISLVNVNSSNTGTYLCQLDNAEQEKVNASGYLTIGQVTTTLIPTGVSVIEFGQSLDVFCNATVTIDLDDELLYTWTFNDEIINETSSILTITYNSADSIGQGGVYHCVAKDTADILEGKSNQILVAFAPIITVQPESVLTMPGDVAELNCNATGHPLPDIEWHKLSMNTTISSLEELDFFSDELLYNETDYIGDILSVSELLIDNVSYADFGYYICVASYDSALLISDCCTNYSNSMQKVYTAFSQPSSVTVSPIDSVQIYPPLINSSFNESIIFNCTSKGGPTNEYQWRHLQTNNVVGNEPILQIDSVSFDKSGSYICTVTNEAGSDSDTAVLNTPVLITSVSEDQTVAVGDTVELICTFKSLLHVTAVWMHNGSAVIDNAAIITSTNESRLSLIEVTLSHSGNYTCILDNGIIEIAMATSFIAVDHLVTSISPSGVFTLEYGNTVNVSCTVRINAATDGLFYSWTFNDASLNITTQWFLLEYNSTLSVVQGGIYQCFVSSGNMIFNGASKQLLITYAPHFTVHPQSLVTTISNNTAIEFSCSAIAHPTPTIEWYRVNSIDNITELNVAQNSLTLANSSFTESNTTDLFEVISFLTIDPVEYEDYGYYVCLASIEDSIIFVRNCCGNNDYNNDTINTSYTSLSTVGTLAVSPEDSVFSEPLVHVASVNENVTFNCTGMGGPNNYFQWTHIDTVREIVGYDSELTIAQVAASNGGSYECLVQNAAGNDTSTSDLLVHPYFIQAPSNVSVLVGSTLTLECDAAGYPLPIVNWMFNGSIIVNGSSIQFGNTISLQNTVSSTLTAESVEFSGRGEYSCSAFNDESTNNSLPIFVTVVVPPVSVQDPANATRNVTEKVMFSCSFEGFPEPTIDWYHNGGQMFSEGFKITTDSFITTTGLWRTSSILNITNIMKENEGIYECVARETIFNNSAESTAILVVQVPPRVTAVVSNIDEAITHQVVISFNITEANPQVLSSDILWTFNGAEIENENETRYIFSLDRLSLTINMLMLSDEGIYRMTAFNPAGSEYDETFINVEVPPIVIEGPTSKKEIAGNNAIFNCIANAEPMHFIEWDFNGQRITNNTFKYTLSYAANSNSSWMLTVLDINLQDDGLYTCIATNIHGIANASAMLEVQVPPLAYLDLNKTSLIITAGLQLRLNCSSLGYPIPVFNWFRNTTQLSSHNDSLDVYFNTYFDIPSTAITTNEIVIGDPRISDTGVYYCQSSNDLVRPLSSETEKLEIQVLSPPDVIEGIDNSTYNITDTLKLSCTFAGFPLPSIQWFFRKSNNTEFTELHDTDRITIATYDITELEGSSSGMEDIENFLDSQLDEYNPNILHSQLLNVTLYLVISDLERNDEGYYSCAANNSIENFIDATITSDAFVTVQHPPIVFTSLRSPVIGLYTQSITLNISIENDHPTVIPNDTVWKFNGTTINDIPGLVIFSEDRKSLTLTTLNINDEGFYTVTASNPAGSNSISIFMDIEVSPIIIDGPNDTAAIEGTEATFTCKVFSEPLHELYWTYENQTLTNTTQYSISPRDQTLTISTSLTISGNYTCFASNIHGIASSTGLLEVQVAPLVTINPLLPPINLTAGEDINLTCMFSGNPPPMINWTLNDQQLMFPHDVNVQVNTNQILPRTTSTLLLKNLNLTNVGSYQCVATTSLVRMLQSNSSMTSLTLQYPPEMSIAPEVLVRGFEEQGSFVCKGFGIPRPTISWERKGDNKMFPETNFEFSSSVETSSRGYNVTVSTLTLNNTGRDLEGTYTCSGVNNVSNIIETNEKIEGAFFIEAKPEVEVATSSDTTTGILSKEIVLVFRVVHAAPFVVPENITWTFDGTQGSQIITLNDDKYTFSEDRLSLTIDDLKFEDDGNYIFTAVNRNGKDSTTLRLVVDEYPSITQISPNLNIVSDKEITISCTARGKPPPTVAWWFKDSQISELKTLSNSYTFVVDSIERVGDYICVAENEHADDTRAFNISVQDPPEYPQNPVKAINGTVSNFIKLNCTVYGYPLPTIDWLKDGEIIDYQDEDLGSGSKYVIQDSMNGNMVTSEITIEDLDYDDNGKYACEAMNSLFEDRVTISDTGLVDVHYPPDLLSGVLNVTKNATDTFTLHCNFSGTPAPNIVWTMTSYLLADMTEMELRESSKISIVSSKDERLASSILTITNLVKNDEGTYKCVGINNVDNLINAIDSSEAFMTVQVPPTITPNRDNYAVTAVKDYQYTISFNIIDDFPKVKPENIYWKFSSDATRSTTLITDNNLLHLSEDRLSLNFLDIELIDRGNYTITATNEAGIRSSTINLNVHVEPRLLNYTGSVHLINGTGGRVTINCTADGIPRPRILWRRNGILIVNTSRTLIIPNEDTDLERSIRVGEINEIQQLSSTLTIFNLRTTDTGLYTCRGDNSAGRAAILQTPYNLTVFEFIPPVPACTRNPTICGSDGRCIDTSFGNFVCDCNEGVTGRLCDEDVIVFVSPTIRNIIASIRGTSPMQYSLPVTRPSNVTGKLFGEISITCTADGNPKPLTTWHKKNTNVSFTGELLNFPELNLTQRGFYLCSAVNQENTISSKYIQVDISDVVQYEVELDIHNMSLTTIPQIEELVTNISSIFSGGVLTGTDGVFYSIIEDPRQQERSFEKELVIVTLITDNGGSPAVLLALLDYMNNILQQNIPEVSVLTTTIDRFDGCSSEVTIIPSYQSNRTGIDVELTWPETNLGQTASVECPCGGLNLSSTALMATRTCGGGYENGAEWEEAYIQPCNFTDQTRQLCNLAMAPAEEKVDELSVITKNTEQFDVAEVTVSVAVLVTATEDISGNTSLTKTFLGVVNNIINVNAATLKESQTSGNTSAKLLESIDALVDTLPVTEDEPVIIAQDTFVIAVQQVNTMEFTGQDFSFDIGDSFGTGNAIISNNTFSISNNNTQTGRRRPTAALALPGNLFASLNTTNNTRITNSIYTTDALFIRRNPGDFDVGSIIISAGIVGMTVQGLDDPPIIMDFVSNPSLENSSNAQCVFWDASLDGGFGDWSSEGCTVNQTIYNETEGINITICHCTHLTSFSVLLDVSPNVGSPSSPEVFEQTLSAVTYIGCIVSIICLVATIISYIANRKLRTSEHGLLLINLCIALIGLYATFILAIHSTFNVGFCAFIGALLQYFFLATFMIMAAEAINLYMKLVIVLGSNIQNFIKKVVIVCWTLPLIIVLLTFAPDYKQYASEHICRALNFQFYIGVLVPFILIYVFNWVIFIIIFANLIYKAKHSRVNEMKDKKKKMEFKQQFVIALTLSILFGLGWGIGLPATQQVQNVTGVRETFATLFVLLTSFQGFFIFFMHCIRSPDIRKDWMRCFKRTTRQDFSETSTSGIVAKKGKSKASDFTSTTSAGEKASAKYKYVKKKNDSSTANEYSSYDGDNDGQSTLRHNLKLAGTTDKDTTLTKFGKGLGAPKTSYLSFIEENESENRVIQSDDDSGSEGWREEGNMATLALPEGVIGAEDFDFDIKSVYSLGRLSMASEVNKNVIFNNPMQLHDFVDGGDGGFDLDTMSVQSGYSQPDTSQTIFVNPMEDTV